MKEALRLYQLASQQGNPWAQTCLGQCYQYGYGVNVNRQEAIRYYKLAADQNFPRANEMLKYLQEQGK